MKQSWSDRNIMVANLFNPAFCGEVMRVVIREYNRNSKKEFPFALTYIILPILLHDATVKRMPRSVRSYLFVWIEENDDLFYSFPSRVNSITPHTKEALMFLLAHGRVSIEESGGILAINNPAKRIEKIEYEGYNEILKKAEMLGKWLTKTSDIKSIYSFLRITP